MALDDLAVAIGHDDPRPVLGLHQNAALRHDRDRPAGVAAIVDQDAKQLSIRLALTHIDCQVFGYRVEDPFLQQDIRSVVADGELQVLELTIGQGHEV